MQLIKKLSKFRYHNQDKPKHIQVLRPHHTAILSGQLLGAAFEHRYRHILIMHWVQNTIILPI